MPFSELFFIYIFLPISLIFYHLWDKTTFKNIVLLITSFIFYAWAEPIYVLILFATASIDFLLAQKMQSNPTKSKFYLLTSLFINLGLLLSFKYLPFLLSILNASYLLQNTHWWVPLGISFYTFKILSYQFDVYYEKIDAETSYLNFLTYAFLFQNIMAGPIVRYIDVQEQIQNRKFNFLQFLEGIQRFGIGLFKKVWIADIFANLVNQFIIPQNENASILGLWSGAAFFAFQIYFDFSGYSDMALGIGKMFGLDFKENFNYPFISKSTSEFWRRWHISLSTWFNDYVFLPLNLNLRNYGKVGLVLGIIITFFLSGFWHGAGWNYIFWGTFFGITISFETLFLKKYLEKWAFLGHIYLIINIVFSMTLFYFTDLNQWFLFMSKVTDFYNVPLYNEFLLWALQENLFLILFAIIASTPIFQLFIQYLQKISKNTETTLTTSLAIILIFWSTTGLLNQTYKAFLYFQF